jgi:hypothetical protein
MDNKNSDNAGDVRRETYSLPPEYLEIINEEQRIHEQATGYRLNRSAVIRKALDLLKKLRQSAESLEESGKANLKKAQKPVKYTGRQPRKK